MNMTSKSIKGREQTEMPRMRRIVVVVDVVESVRLMQAHESDVIDRWRRFVREVRFQVLPSNGGRLVKSLGDGMLLEFVHISEALSAVRELRLRINPYNFGKDADSCLTFRIGMHAADVFVDEDDIYGVGVNLAARLASLAQPGQVVVSEQVRDQIVIGLDGEIEDLGECFLKHIPEPVRSFRFHDLSINATPADPPVMSSIQTSVAVMSFRPRLAEERFRAAGDLLADEVVASLSRTPYLRVISRLSTEALARRTADARQLGEWLGATYVVSGSFDCDGTHLIVHAEMAYAPGGTVLWLHRWSCVLADLLAGQDVVVSDMVSEISKAVVQREIERCSQLPLPSLDSHGLLMSGIGLIHRSSACDFDRAHELLDLLANRHARLPHANAWLGKWHVLRAVQGLTVDPGLDARRALDRSNRALDADPSSSLALTMKGHVHGFLLKDLSAAEKYLQMALDLNPNEPLAWIYMATLRAWQGRANEGLAVAHHAFELSPLDPMRYYYETLLAFIAMSAGDFRQAKECARKSLRAQRIHLSSHRTLAISLWNLGECGEARAIVEAMLKIDPSFTTSKYLGRYPGGDNEQARLNARTLLACGVPA